MRITLIAAAALALSACQPAAQQNAAENTADELDAIGNDEGANATNVQAVVLGMSDKTRNVVLVRAIMDSNMTCDGVEKSERLPDQPDGSPVWKAFCRNGTSHIVIFGKDGMAKVLSPR